MKTFKALRVWCSFLTEFMIKDENSLMLLTKSDDILKKEKKGYSLCKENQMYVNVLNIRRKSLFVTIIKSLAEMQAIDTILKEKTDD